MSQAKKNSIFRSPFSSKENQTSLLTAISIVGVLVGYIWFVSFGLWTKWHNTTDYYDQLATAFGHGSLSLEKQVNPALLTLPDPYEPKERAKIDYPLDFTLYNGKYYLYFGPVPALALLPFKFLGFGKINDQYLVFIFISGIFIFQSLLIMEIRERFSPEIPVWLLSTCIIFGGLVAPLTWMLTEGRVYEASGAGGQFFFIMGLYFAFTALKKDPISSRRLLISSISWVLAVGSRITQALPVGFVVLVLIFLVIRASFQTKSLSQAVCRIAAIGLPLAIGIGILGWYDWARFGSVFETGFSYQLTTTFLQQYSRVLFSPIYALPNLYDYVAAPPKIDSLFPFLKPIRGRGNLVFPFLVMPKIYYTRAMTGFLFSTPFVLFACLSVISIPFPTRGAKTQENPNENGNLLRWTIISLLGAFLLGFGVIISFFWVVTRYLIECMPALIILSIIGFWLGYRWLSHWPVIRYMYTAIGVGLAIISIAGSNLLVLSMRASLFQTLNPVLWNQLNSLFAH